MKEYFRNSLISILRKPQATLLQTKKSSTIYMLEYCWNIYIWLCQNVANNISYENPLKTLQSWCKLLYYKPISTPQFICMSFVGLLVHLCQNVANNSVAKCSNSMVAMNKSFENSLMTFLGMLQAILLQASKNSTIYMKEHCDSTYIQC